MNADLLVVFFIVLFVVALIVAALCIAIFVPRKNNSKPKSQPFVVSPVPANPPPKLDAASMYVFSSDEKKKVCRMCECENPETARCCEVCGTTL